MAKQTINTGASVDDLTAESIVSAFTKVNAMTSELFSTFSLGGRLAIDLDATPDTIRGAFVKTNTNLAALYTEQSLPSVPVIDVGDVLDDPVPSAETIYAAFTKVNTALAAVYASLEPPPTPETADYYVATTGSDNNPGTIGSPFRTIAKGASLLTPGKTLMVRGGTYAESLINTIPSGTSWSALVRIVAYPGETVWMRPPSGHNRVIEFAGSQKYIEIDGINLDGSNVGFDNVKINAGATFYAHHIRFKNLESRHTRTGGNTHHFIVADSGGHPGFNEFINLTVHGGGGDDFCHGFYIRSSNNLVERCNIYDIAGNGVQLFNQDATTVDDNVVRYNVIHDFTRIYGRHRAVTVSRGLRNLVYGNLVYNISAATGSFRGGINVDLTAAQTSIFNNTVYGSNQYGIRLGADAGSNAVVRNNIAYQNAAGNYLDDAAGTTQDHNIFAANPLFVNAGAQDFRLQAGSPAVNTGTTIAIVTSDLDGTSRPQGSAYDIGAYQYVP